MAGNNPRTESGKRLYSLDALRGLAALAVVVVHYELLFPLSGLSGSGYDPVKQLPFFAALAPIYYCGNKAVELFFSLSGFATNILAVGQSAGLPGPLATAAGCPRRAMGLWVSPGSRRLPESRLS